MSKAAPSRRGPVLPPRALALAALTLVLALLLLLLAQAGVRPASAGDAGKSAAAGDIWAELERIERQLRARPREQSEALQKLQGRSGPGSPERLEALSLRAQIAARLRDRTQLEALVSELRHWPVASGKPAAEACAAVALARLQQEQGELGAARKTLQVLDGLPAAALPPRIHQRAQSLRGNVLVEVGEADAALIAAQDSLRLAEQIGQPWRQAIALADLAWTYHRAQQFERAREVSELALAKARLDPDAVTLHTVATIHGIVYADHADARITQQAYADTLRYAREAGSEQMLALSLGNLADYHLRRGEYAQALQFAEQALPLARRSQSQSAETLALHNMGIAKIGLRRVAEGTRDVRQAIRYDEEQGAQAYAAEGWAELGRHLESAGDLEGAIAAHHSYRRLIDQVLRDETRKAVLEAQESFDAERRSKEIELLGRENALKSEQLRSRDLQLQLWAAVAGCIVVSAGLLGLAYRRIRRANQDLARSNAHLKQQSECDPLTGLANRRHFQSAIRTLADAGKLNASVFLIDIDWFKRINDQHGHAAGDSVLVETAQRLRSALRESDLVVRWGGEEFLIVVPERTPADVHALAQRLLDLIGGRPVQHADRSIAISASIGFASFPLAPHGLGLGWERAIDLVDTVMYLAKAHGRNRAYGVSSVAAQDEAALLRLMPRIEAAWHAGDVVLLPLQGPALRQGAPA